MADRRPLVIIGGQLQELPAGDNVVGAVVEGGASTLDGLTDVQITGAVAGQVLKYNGTNWVNGTDNVGSGGGGSSWLEPVVVGGGLTVSGQVIPNFLAASDGDVVMASATP